MSIAVEKIESGDGVIVWLDGEDRPREYSVRSITEGVTGRTLHLRKEGGVIDLVVPHGRTVDLSR